MTELNEQRPEALKELFKISRTEKELKHRKLQILSQLSNTTKNQELLAVVDKLHKAILENSPDIQALMDLHLTEEEKLLFLKNKNKGFFKGAQIFEKYQEHPVQKNMQKAGYINRRKIKKEKTPSNHVGVIAKAKKDYERDRRLEVLEILSRMHTQQIDSIVALTQQNKDLIAGSTQTKKIAFNKIRKEQPNMTQSALAELFGVTDRTIRNWIKESSSQS